MAKRMLPIGIDDLACYVPKMYLDIETLAEERGIPYAKLSKGLGLYKMALPDYHEDAATMAAEAIAELLERNQIDPRTIGRIYLGTESALDMAKPTGTYAVEMLSQRFGETYGSDCFQNCDVLDMTFACIGATDALLNTLDWVASDPEHIGIVVASDIAKYELHSTGEYTQGAGAVAMLVKWHPRLMAIRTVVGVGMESVHDFFKPRRERFCETPVFDGQYSNECYQNRMVEALQDFRRKAIAKGVFKSDQYPALSDRWERMIFHLPYAFHAKRMYVETFVSERKASGTWEADCARYGFAEPLPDVFDKPEEFVKAKNRFLKSVSDSVLYQRFVDRKLEKAQRASSETGNLYTASIFMALMSTLSVDFQEGKNLAGRRFGFVAYGSGSKAKVFEGTIQAGWEKLAGRFGLFEKLADRVAVSYAVYEELHGAQKNQALAPDPGRWGLSHIGTEGALEGARYYSVLEG
ncbi:MAG: hydroxymethylglutaryl-CoA synthase [Saprospiraceae bacterium]